MKKKLITYFNNIILFAAIISNFLLIVLFIYRFSAHGLIFNFISISTFLIFLFFYIIVLIFFNHEWKTAISISSITIVASILLAELFLSKSTRFNLSLAMEKRFEKAKLLEPRSKIEFILDLTAEGKDPVPVIPPSTWRGKLDYISDNDSVKYSSDNNVFPLGGISNKLTINCNESGFWSNFISDKHGFNNPNYSYEIGLDIVTIGDSFVHGACVKQGEDIASQLRELNYSALNFGYGGNGPLIELATLLDYASYFKPKVVLWFYHRGDIEDLFLELKNEILQKYLSGNFNQNLLQKQNEIDNFLLQYLERRISSVNIMVQYYKNKKTADFLKSELIFSSEDHSKITEILYFFKLTNIRKLFNLYDTKFLCLDYFCNRETQAEFAKILTIAKNKTNDWGGKFYFVYLPSWEEYTNNKPYIKNKNDIIKIVKDININIIDFHEFLEIQKDPLEYFPFRLPNHYTSDGYKLVSSQISSVIKDDL